MSLTLYAGNSELIQEKNFNDIKKIELQLNPQITETGFDNAMRNLENNILTNLPDALETLSVSLIMDNVTNVEKMDLYYMFNNLPVNLKLISIVMMKYNINNKKNDVDLIRKKITTSTNFKIPFDCYVHFVGF